jgi:cohesin complex subunit SCC1
LPAHATTAIDLNLPELLTVDDIFNMDFDFPMTQQPSITGGRVRDADDDWTSSLNPAHNSTQSMLTPGEEPLYNDDDLQLDFNGDEFVNDTTVSINVGRNAPTPKQDAEEVLPEEGLLHDDEDGLNLDFTDIPMPDQPDITMGDDQPMFGDDQPLFDGDETLQLQQAADNARHRATESPPSEANSEVLRDLDQTFQQPEEEVEEAVAQQRRRKQKPIAPDVETTLHNSQIKAQAEDRSKILRAPSFLPRDPLLLSLMNMQKSGAFVFDAINDGRSRNLAPELQGLLSFETVFRPGQKRKRDSGIAGLSEDDENSEFKSPRLEGPEDNVDEAIQMDDAAHRSSPLPQQPMPDSGAGGGLDDNLQNEDDDGTFAGDDTFDETAIPLIHPADSGPVSLGTKHAVHLLRDRLGGESGSQPSPSKSTQSVLLHDIIPEGRTNKEDATKMFFEVLVLATKDAIKVEQQVKSIGLPLRIRAKRGLWGAWAETRPEEDPLGSSQQIAVSA